MILLKQEEAFGCCHRSGKAGGGLKTKTSIASYTYIHTYMQYLPALHATICGRGRATRPPIGTGSAIGRSQHGARGRGGGGGGGRLRGNDMSCSMVISLNSPTCIYRSPRVCAGRIWGEREGGFLLALFLSLGYFNLSLSLVSDMYLYPRGRNLPTRRRASRVE